MIVEPKDGDSLLRHTEDIVSADESQVQNATVAANNNAWTSGIVKMQSFALLLAHVLSALSVLTVISWVYSLGGLSWSEGKSKTNFNWHPLLMVAAFCFMTVASLSFRHRQVNRKVLKLTHGMAWLVAALCAIVALIAVFKSHNDSVNGFIANLYSLHSWIGCAVIGMYVCQFLVGVLAFAWPPSFVTTVMKLRVLQVHRFVGPFIYNCTAATILLGLQEKEGFIGCSYTVTKADTFPLQHFFDIPSVCRTSHALGILVLLVTLCTNLALHDFRTLSSAASTSQHDS